MDRFEQLTAYFVAIKDFNDHRDVPIACVVTLTTTLPDLLAMITQPRLKAKLQSVMAANSGMLCRTG